MNIKKTILCCAAILLGLSLATSANYSLLAQDTPEAPTEILTEFPLLLQSEIDENQDIDPDYALSQSAFIVPENKELANRDATTAFLFATLFAPDGITTLNNRNVLVYQLDINSPLTLFSPLGDPLAQVNSGIGGVVASSTSLTTYRPSGEIVAMRGDGRVYLINPNFLTVTPWFNVKDLFINYAQIYNVATQTFGTAAGVIQPYTADYGDISILPIGTNRYDIFITGSSEGAPFILKINVFPDNSYTARVIIGSSHISAFNTLPRGVAVNDDGIVLTSMGGVFGFSASVDRLAAFSASFPEDGSLPLYSPYSVTTRGIDVDLEGHFYVGMNVVDFCPQNGGLLVLTKELFLVDCLLAPGFTTQIRHAAVQPSGGVAYLTTNQNQVYAFLVPDIPDITKSYLTGIVSAP